MSGSAIRRDVHVLSATSTAVDVAAGAGIVVAWLQASPARADHEPCEDSAAVVSIDDACALIVADGVGGHRGGAEASQLTVAAIVARLEAGDVGGLQLQAAVMAGVESANRDLIGGGGSASTVLVALIHGDQLRCVHAGDSELLVVGQRGKIKHQTVSHSPVGYGVEAGLIEVDEGLAHEERHLISSCVGMEGMRVEVASAISLAARDTVVLASDGLWDNLHVAEVTEIVRKGPLQAALQQLAAKCAQRMRGEDPEVAGKVDDLAILLYRRR